MTDEHIQILPLRTGEKSTILPLTRKEVPTDRVYLLPTTDAEMSPALDQTPEGILSGMMGLDVETLSIAETFDEQYVAIYGLIQEHIGAGRQVWVNGSEVPHASILAMSTSATEWGEFRDRLHYYRVDGEVYEELPLPVDHIKITPIRVDILTHLADGSEATSISELAAELSDGELDSSFRGTVQYNTEALAEAGFVRRVNHGNRMAPELTRSGRLWLKTHGEGGE